jgi:hypothetical protein
MEQKSGDDVKHKQVVLETYTTTTFLHSSCLRKMDGTDVIHSFWRHCLGGLDISICRRRLAYSWVRMDPCVLGQFVYI